MNHLNRLNLSYVKCPINLLHHLYQRMLNYRLKQKYPMNQKKQRLQNCQMILNDPSYQHCQKRQM